jgi:hypothetical protein
MKGYKFKYPRNQASKSSVNIKENSSSEKMFYILRTRLIQPSLAVGCYRQESSATPALLVWLSLAI